MKIISKFKDYYDYLQGVYGIDEKVVYERHMENGYEKPDHLKLHTYNDKILKYDLAICGIIYIIFTYKGKYYFGLEGAEELVKVADTDYIENETLGNTSLESFIRFYDNKWVSRKEKHLSKTTLNEEYDCPILLLREGHRGTLKGLSINVCLSDYGIPAIIPAHDMYIQLSTFLTKKDEIEEDTRTDVEKAQGRGFDKIRSFRKMKRD